MDYANLLYGALLAGILGTFEIWQGWIRVRNPESGVSSEVFEPLTIILSHLFQGEDRTE